MYRGYTLLEVEVYLGKHDLTNSNEAGSKKQKISSSNVIIHENYDDSTNVSLNIIAKNRFSFCLQIANFS